ncbi:hypothetical protein MIR68_009387 [Amoeboaphelidium protococcarum]|nr:hypothetical protein MIR68_009387 [Amoeboaphelidium protococcarum]
MDNADFDIDEELMESGFQDGLEQGRVNGLESGFQMGYSRSLGIYSQIGYIKHYLTLLPTCEEQY